MSERVRIHKALADAGVASRRRAEQLVIEGRVSVNGVAAGIGQLVDRSRDAIEVDGRALNSSQERVYLVMAKPAGVTSTVSDRHAGRTVIDLVPVALRRRVTRVYPVGRLDRDSEGLLLLTNDGGWAQRMLHPSHGVEREYEIGLERLLEPDQQRALEHGIEMEEGIARLFGLRRQTVTESRMLAGVIGGETKPVHWYHATLRQGMKRQLRRMFAAVGNPVRRLVRVRFGTLSLAGMTLGDVRELTTAELRQLEQLTRRRAAQREAGRGLIVSLDGPGGSGKSTVGARAATELEYRFCDTGVLYRGLTWLAVEHEVDLDDPAALARLVPQIELAPDDNQRYVRLLVDGREVTTELHTAAVDREVSRVSQHAPVREALLPVQRRLAAPGRLIMAGRDIGTVILPDADLKLFLEVSVEERARRRARERGLATDVRAQEQIEEDLRRRDSIDSSREAGPLRVPEGATIVHTEGNTLDETVADVVDVIRRAERNERLQ